MPTWKQLLENNPDHSDNYAMRWKRLAAQGNDLDGEARLIDAMAARRSRILDAGCGTGRVGGVLGQRGHDVVGVDLDPKLIEYAKAEFPDCHWQVGDLGKGEVPEGPFDIAFCAGNVFGFIEEGDRVPALRALASVLADDGRLVIGFGAGRGLGFEQFIEECRQAGLRAELKLATWDVKPFTPASDFLVAVLVKG